MFQSIPTYIVTWTQHVGSHTHEIACRVPETDLDAFLRVLRFNGATKFSALLDT
jgi:hypothetical protein